MRRRTLLRLIGFLVLSTRANAQESRPVIGFMNAGKEKAFERYFAAFLSGLKSMGFTDTVNASILARWAEGDEGRIQGYLSEFVSKKVDVIVASGSLQTSLAAKAGAADIPVVFTTGSDPVQAGLVDNLPRRQGNITGISFFGADLVGKRLDILLQIKSSISRVTVLTGTNSVETQRVKDIIGREAAIRNLKVKYVALSPQTDLAKELNSLDLNDAEGVLYGSDPYFVPTSPTIARILAERKIPAVGQVRADVEQGGLAIYGTSIADAWYEAGRYVGRILKGEKPSDLPVLQSSRFELILNQATAHKMNLVLSSQLLSFADEVIE